MQRLTLPVALSAAIATLGSVADAAPLRVGVVLPVGSAPLEKEIMSAVNDLARAQQARVVSGKGLVRDMKSARRRCGKDAACWSRSVRRAKIERLIVTQFTKSAPGIVLDVTVIDVAKRTAIEQLRLSGENTASIGKAVRTQLASVFASGNTNDLPLVGLGGPSPSAAKSEEVPLLDLGDPSPTKTEEGASEIDELALTALPSSGGESGDGLDELALVGFEADPVTEEDTTDVGDDEEEEDELALEAVPAADINGVDLAMLPPPVVPSPAGPAFTAPWLIWTGYVLAGAGVVVFGIGAGFGLESQSLASLPGGITQLDASERQQNQHAIATNATILMISGAASAALGAAAILVDLTMFSDDTDAKASVSAGPGNVRVMLHW